MIAQAAGFALLAAISPTALFVMAVFLGSHAVCPQNKSPFSELRCEVADDQYPRRAGGTHPEHGGPDRPVRAGQ